MKQIKCVEKRGELTFLTVESKEILEGIKKIFIEINGKIKKFKVRPFLRQKTFFDKNLSVIAESIDYKIKLKKSLKEKGRNHLSTLLERNVKVYVK